MKKGLWFLLLLLGASANAHAFNLCPFGNNPWPAFTPMYWANEMFNDHGYRYRPYGRAPYYGTYGYPAWGYGYPYYYAPGR